MKYKSRKVLDYVLMLDTYACNCFLQEMIMQAIIAAVIVPIEEIRDIFIIIMKILPARIIRMDMLKMFPVLKRERSSLPTKA